MLSENPDVSWVGEYSAIGFFHEGEKTITVAYGNENYFLHQAEKTFQGTIPQGSNEIMLPANYLEFSGKAYQIGEQVTLDFTGTGKAKEYTLSAILNEEEESKGYYIYVSKELAQTISNNMLQIDAYTRLKTDAITSPAIFDSAEKVALTADIEKGQIFLTEYFSVMTGVTKSGITIPVPILAVITAVLTSMSEALKTATTFEIHCWNEETEWIDFALHYGKLKDFDWRHGKVIVGEVTPEFVKMLLEQPKPADIEIYNKMMLFFTIVLDNGFSPAHYGTELTRVYPILSELEF